MNVKKLFGKNLTLEVKELLALLLSERMTILSKEEETKNPRKYQEISENLNQ